jgi:regulator of replication initiation timing
MSENIPNIDLSKIPDKHLANQIEKLFNIVEMLMKKVAELEAENIKLKAENARLKGQSKKPSFPNRDYSAGKRANLNAPQNDKEKQGKKDRTKIDREVTLPSVEACDCGSAEFTIIRTMTKVVQDIIITTNNILYKGCDKKCKNCGKVFKVQIPLDIKNLQFGPSLSAWISCFAYDFRASQVTIHRFLSELGIQISKGQISNMILNNAQKLRSSYTSLKRIGIGKSKYLHTDATGAKRKQSTKSNEILSRNLHFVGHELLSIFTVTTGYSSKVVSNILGIVGRTKALVSDDHASYAALEMSVKQLCWIHTIRHFKKLGLYAVPYHKSLLTKTINKIWLLYDQLKLYKQNPTQELKVQIIGMFDSIFSRVTRYSELDVRLKLTLKNKSRLLAVLDHPELAIENNLSERAVKDPVLIRKSSGGTKSDAGDRSLETHLSIIQTARKQGLNIYETIYGLMNSSLSPAILTAKTVAYSA